MKPIIEIQHHCSHTRGRNGFLQLPHGKIEIPAFMPVGTNGTVKAITPNLLEEMEYRLILGNTYHLYLRPGLDVIKQAGGLREFSSWSGNILTDSGGFQVFSLAPFRKIREEGVEFQSHIDGSYHQFTPEKIVDIQRDLNSDIQMALDYCTPPGTGRQEAERALGITTAWAGRAYHQWLKAREEGYQGYLFPIIQGNFYKDLRKQSAEEILALDTPGVAIGGLSVGEAKEVFLEYLEYTAPFLPDDRVRYLMGIGTPDYILAAVENGIDIFDCVYPTRIARNSTVFTRDGTIALKRAEYTSSQAPPDPECRCPVCQRYSRSYLRHLFKAGEILGPMLATQHNLFFLQTMMQEIRKSIKQNYFLEYKRKFLSRYSRNG